MEETRTLINSEQAPEPLEDSARCMRCSHVGICLPEERKLCAVAHRVMVSSPDNQVTHLATPGAKAFTRSGRMIVQKMAKNLLLFQLIPCKVCRFTAIPICQVG